MWSFCFTPIQSGTACLLNLAMVVAYIVVATTQNNLKVMHIANITTESHSQSEFDRQGNYIALVIISFIILALENRHRELIERWSHLQHEQRNAQQKMLLCEETLTERLLRNMLPEHVLEQLRTQARENAYRCSRFKSDPRAAPQLKLIANNVYDCTVMFCKIDHSALITSSASDTVRILNIVFTTLDRLTARHSR